MASPAGAKHMKINNLGTIDIGTIHAAFIDAFSEYEVKIDLPVEKLQEMLLMRDYEPSLSLGCFEDSRLIGFVLTGCRQIDGKRCGYDTGTGVIKEYQNRHVGSMLMEGLIESIKKNEMGHYQLEVLENNIAAQSLYEKYGFRVSRRLRCYEYFCDGAGEPITWDETRDISVLDAISPEEYVSFAPTWQNSLKSFLNNRNKYYFAGYECDGHLTGYGIIHGERADMLQIGVASAYRGTGLEKKIMERMARAIGKNKVTILNVEDDSYMQIQLDKVGCKNFINQYEMVYTNR